MAGIRKAVFPVAGLGTRMLPASKVVPKELLPLVDTPLIQLAIEEAAAAGVEQFILVTGRGKTILEDHFDRAVELYQALERKGREAELERLRAAVPAPGNVVSTRQQEPLGLGHAVWCARHLVGTEPFAVILVDDLILAEVPCLAQMADAQRRTGGCVVATMEVPLEHTPRYGIVAPGAEHGRLVEVQGLVEKPRPEVAPSRLAVIGRYILTPEVFVELERHERGAGGEIQLTDAMARLLGRVPFHGLRFDGHRFDCGDKLGYLEAILAYAASRPDLAPGLRTIIDRYR